VASGNGRAVYIRNLGGYDLVNTLERIGRFLHPKKGVRMGNTAFLIFNHRNMGDIFPENPLVFKSCTISSYSIQDT
jgi:hypothetical protein